MCTPKYATFERFVSKSQGKFQSKTDLGWGTVVPSWYEQVPTLRMPASQILRIPGRSWIAYFVACLVCRLVFLHIYISSVAKILLLRLSIHLLSGLLEIVHSGLVFGVSHMEDAGLPAGLSSETPKLVKQANSLETSRFDAERQQGSEENHCTEFCSTQLNRVTDSDVV